VKLSARRLASIKHVVANSSRSVNSLWGKQKAAFMAAFCFSGVA